MSATTVPDRLRLKDANRNLRAVRSAGLWALSDDSKCANPEPLHAFQLFPGSPHIISFQLYSVFRFEPFHR